MTSAVTPTVEPAPNIARPTPKPVSAANNAPPLAIVSNLPPALSGIDNNVKTLCFIFSPKTGSKKLVTDATPAPIPNAARPTPNPVMTRKNVAPSPKNSSILPAPSSDGTIVIISLIF